jgi:transcriptional regulator with XRE-family HTH domain
MRSARQALGWTQSELAKKAKVDRSKLSLYESGQVDLTAEELDRVEDAVSHARIPRRFVQELQRRVRRQQAGLSQQELANKAGISRPKLSRWESGQLELAPEELERVEQALSEAPKSSPLSALVDARYVKPLSRVEGTLFDAAVAVGPKMAGQQLTPDAVRREVEHWLSEQVIILKDLVAVQQQIIDIQKELLKLTSEEKDVRILELETKVSELRELYEVGTQAVMATSRYEELRDKVLANRE